MPVITQKFISRSDLRNNPKILYLFGDNEQRKGLGGQAKEMLGEPNATGVRTKAWPGYAPGAFWYDEPNPEEKIDMIIEDLKPAALHLSQGGILVIPEDGLGTGLSKLPEKAPTIFAALKGFLQELHDYVPEAKTTD